MAQHLHLQAQSHAKSGSKAKPFSQAHIHFKNPRHDRQNVSARTGAVLRAIMAKSGVSEIWVTSTVRSADEQAGTMLHNMQHPATNPKTHKSHRVNYQPPGSMVNVIGALNLANNFGSSNAHKLSERDIQHEMTGMVDAVGPDKVSHHTASKKRQTVDFILGNHATKEQNDAVVAYVKHLVALKIVSGFGWPSGPGKRVGALFNDGKCFHIEVPQQ